MDSSDRKTYAEIQAQRHKEAREREEQAKAWAAEVTEQLFNQRSSFIEDMERGERQIQETLKCKA